MANINNKHILNNVLRYRPFVESCNWSHILSLQRILIWRRLAPAPASVVHSLMMAANLLFSHHCALAFHRGQDVMLIRSPHLGCTCLLVSNKRASFLAPNHQWVPLQDNNNRKRHELAASGGILMLFYVSPLSESHFVTHRGDRVHLVVEIACSISWRLKSLLIEVEILWHDTVYDSGKYLFQLFSKRYLFLFTQYCILQGGFSQDQ